MINIYAYRIIRAAFLRNVKQFNDRREAVEYMIARRKEYMPQLVA